MAQETGAKAKVEGAVREAWQGGGIVDIEVEALGNVDGWTVDIDVGGRIENIWNARILGREGNVYRIGPLDYNARIGAGDTVEFGVEVTGTAQFVPVSIDAAAATEVPSSLPPAVTLAAPLPVAPANAGDVASGAPTAQLAQATPAVPTAAASAETASPPATTPPQTAPALTPQVVTPPSVPPSAVAPDDARPVLPTGTGLGPDALRLPTQSVRYYDAPDQSPAGLFAADDTVSRPDGPLAGLPRDSFAPGPLSTEGVMIVDSAGNRADIHGVNWFGLETDLFTPHGLWARNWRDLMDEAKSLGFNTLRIPFSGELVDAEGGTPTSIDYGLNPDLEGLNGLEILDAIVGYADRIGLRILLDYHRGVPGNGPNDNGLWYGEGRTEADVIAEWRVMAERYASAPAVIGADLVNEPHMATWGDGSATDWAAAAERIGNAVHEVAPDWLIVVEGISIYEGDVYWWGGNLQGVRERPVHLAVPDKLVYSPHDYPASVHAQDWFFDGTDLTEKFRENWGFIVEEGIAPVIIGEWGSRLETSIDKAWALDLARYLDRLEIPWFWWALNPNSGDTGGVLLDDWQGVRTDVTGLLEPFLAETRPAVPLQIGLLDTGASADFAVSLDAPAVEEIPVKFATTDGTAKAGSDYLASAGELVFAPGEQVKSVSVPILPDAEAEGDEFFYLVLDGPGALDTSATARIEENRPPGAEPPFVDVASAVVSETATTARFRVMLSEAAQRDVTIGFSAVRDTAPNEPTRGSFIIPQGAREATVEVTIDDNGGSNDATRYTLDLTSADGARLRTAEAVALVASEPPAMAEAVMGGGSAGQPRMTVEIAVGDDWGSGSLFNVVLKNVSDTPVNAWQMALDVPFDVVELWSAVVVSDEGDRVTLRNDPANGVIAPGESVDFGFIADEGGLVLQQVIEAAGLELVVQ